MSRRAAPRTVPATIGKEGEAKRRRLTRARAPEGVVRTAPPGGRATTGKVLPMRLTVRHPGLAPTTAPGGPTSVGGVDPGGGGFESGWKLSRSDAARTLSAAT